MTLTLEQAQVRLGNIATGDTEALKNLINELSVEASGNKTILYSGMGEDFSKTLSNNPDIRFIDNTQAFEFLEGLKRNEIFAEAWIKITGVKPDWQNDYSGNKK